MIHPEYRILRDEEPDRPGVTRHGRGPAC
jgi:hypothetical protein